MMLSKKKIILRKNYFIKKSFQSKFIALFVLLLFVEALLIAGLFMYMSGETLTTGYSGTHFVIEKTSTFFVVSFTIIIFVVATAMTIAGISLFIFLSHRIAGPLYRFEETLKDICGGDLTVRINLRKNDQLKTLQSTFNEAVEKINSQIREVKSDLNEADGLAVARAKEKLSFFKTS